MVRVEIYKDPIIAWVVLRCKYLNREGYFIDVKPIVIDWDIFSSACFGYVEKDDGMSCYDKFEDNEEVLAVIPAQPETYLVYAWVNNTPIVLGIEVRGAHHPDWKQLALEKYKEKQRR